MSIRTSARPRQHRTVLALLLIPLVLVVIVKNPEAAASMLGGVIHIVAVFLGGVADIIGGILQALTT